MNYNPNYDPTTAPLALKPRSNGPWIMADMEAGLFSGYNARKNDVASIDSWRFVTATVNGGGGNKWDLRGGNAQQGGLTTFYSGARPGSQNNNSYFPMRKPGGILLGTGGELTVNDVEPFETSVHRTYRVVVK